MSGLLAALALLGTVAAGPSYALDCIAERLGTCDPGGCRLSPAGDEPPGFSFERNGGQLSYRQSEGAASGRLTLVTSREAFALAALLGPMKIGGRPVDRSSTAFSAQVDRSNNRFIAQMRGQLLLGSCS
jgi:hypothetical protein